MLNPRQTTPRLLDRAKAMRSEPSDAEKKLWQGLRAYRLDGLKFKRQFPIGDYIADFACDECRLVVEVDGLQHDNAIEYDEKRTAVLESLGWRVIRFYAGNVVRDVDQVLRAILFTARKPSP